LKPEGGAVGDWLAKLNVDARPDGRASELEASRLVAESVEAELLLKELVFVGCVTGTAVIERCMKLVDEMVGVGDEVA
jgi:hypothetical protein